MSVRFCSLDSDIHKPQCFNQMSQLAMSLCKCLTSLNRLEGKQKHGFDVPFIIIVGMLIIKNKLYCKRSRDVPSELRRLQYLKERGFKKFD